MGQPKTRVSARSGAMSLLCILLILFAAVAQANHVHVGKANAPSHECSVCSVAHSAAQAKAAYLPIPIVVRSVLTLGHEVISKPFRLISSLYIRPPPTV